MIVIHEFASQPHVETPLGHGLAVFVVVGPADHQWTVALDNGALVTFPQERIRLSDCYTAGRGISDAKMREIVNLEPRHLDVGQKLAGQRDPDRTPCPHGVSYPNPCAECLNQPRP